MGSNNNAGVAVGLADVLLEADAGASENLLGAKLCPKLQLWNGEANLAFLLSRSFIPIVYMFNRCTNNYSARCFNEVSVGCYEDIWESYSSSYGR